jgi:hypothetical protein
MESANTIATPETLPQFVTAGQIAKLYKITPAAVRFWAKTGRVPCLKFEGTLRFDLAKVRQTVEGKNYEAAAIAGAQQ